MDPQQEIFSALLIALKEKYKNTGIGVYDTFLPPEGTAYPFVYLGATTQSDQNMKDVVIGNVSQTVHVWHDNPRKRGTVSQIMLDIKTLCRSIEHTKNFGWAVKMTDQRILPDTTTKQPLLHGVLEFEFSFS